MGILSDFKAVRDLQRIKLGGTAKLSTSQITCLIVNMPDAQKNLPREQFEQVYSLYRKLRTCNTKMKVDYAGYLELAVEIILMFDELAPYEKYSGGNEFETFLMMKEIHRR